jgi:glycosyl transferase family 87
MQQPSPGHDDSKGVRTVVTRQPSTVLRSPHWLLLVFSGLILAYAFMAWNARDRISQGNSDFIIYYTAVRIVQSGQHDSLYNLELQATTQKALLESMGSQLHFFDDLLPYNHPPFEILFFLPLGYLPYLKAFLVWGVVSIACVVASVGLLLRDGSNWFREPGYFLGAFAFLPVSINLLQGQDSASTLLFLTLAFQGFRQSKDVQAGLWLSLVLQRFQFLPLILLILLFKRRWKALGGFVAGAFAIFLGCLYVVGTSGLQDYARLVIEMTGWIERKGIYPSQMQCLRGQAYALWYPAHPQWANGATALATVILGGVLLLAWQGPWQPGRARFDLQFGLLVLIGLVASPHLNFHDLTLLVLPAILILRNTGGRNLTAPLKHLRVGTLVLCYPVTVAALIASVWGPLRLGVWGMLMVVLLLRRELSLRTETRLEIMDA